MPYVIAHPMDAKATGCASSRNMMLERIDSRFVVMLMETGAVLHAELPTVCRSDGQARLSHELCESHWRRRGIKLQILFVDVLPLQKLQLLSLTW